MAEKEQDAQIAMDRRTLEEGIWLAKAGYWSATMLAALTLAAGVLLGALGHDWLAFETIGTSLGIVVYGFLRQQKPPSPSEKSK